MRYQDLEDQIDDVLERTRASRYSAVIIGIVVGALLVLIISLIVT